MRNVAPETKFRRKAYSTERQKFCQPKFFNLVPPCVKSQPCHIQLGRTCALAIIPHGAVHLECTIMALIFQTEDIDEAPYRGIR
jgi:hypothetical protein